MYSYSKMHVIKVDFLIMPEALMPRAPRSSPDQRMRGPVWHGCVLQDGGFGVGSMVIPDGDCLWRIVWPEVKRYGSTFVAP
jgi:hypothetical protein